MTERGRNTQIKLENQVISKQRQTEIHMKQEESRREWEGDKEKKGDFGLMG